MRIKNNADLILRLKDAPLDLKVFSCDEGGLYPVFRVRSIYIQQTEGEYTQVDENEPEAFQVLLVE